LLLLVEDSHAAPPSLILQLLEAANIAMPNFPWAKSNRSHQSVDNISSGQQSPVASGKGVFEPPMARALTSKRWQ
jgi:hypothetical protein